MKCMKVDAIVRTDRIAEEKNEKCRENTSLEVQKSEVTERKREEKET